MFDHRRSALCCIGCQELHTQAAQSNAATVSTQHSVLLHVLYTIRTCDTGGIAVCSHSHCRCQFLCCKSSQAEHTQKVQLNAVIRIHPGIQATSVELHPKSSTVECTAHDGIEDICDVLHLHSHTAHTCRPVSTAMASHHGIQGVSVVLHLLW